MAYPLLRGMRSAIYEIDDADFARTGEVMIWARSHTPPRIGELFNIETSGALHELGAREVRTFVGGWMAVCQAPDGAPEI